MPPRPDSGAYAAGISLFSFFFALVSFFFAFKFLFAVATLRLLLDYV